MLDKAAYHGLAGEVVAALSPHTESDPVALLLQYLTSFGNMAGGDMTRRKPHIRIANADHYPNIFALIVGRTARSRKGTSAQDIRAVIDRTDPDWVRNNVKSGISSGEGIIEMVATRAMRWTRRRRRWCALIQVYSTSAYCSTSASSRPRSRR